jgi:uncharacterized membrane protein
MAKAVSSSVSGALGNAARGTLKNVGGRVSSKTKASPLSGAQGVAGVAAGVGLAAAVPLARKGIRVVRAGRLARTPAKVADSAATKVSDHAGSKLKDFVSEKVDESGGAGGIVKDAASGLIPGLGGGDGGGGGKGGMPGVGKGRRMPVQQSVDVAVPIETAYNQWTQFEDWPEYMHRVTRVTQDDECTVKFATKIWGKTKEFEAKIETQRPDERIKWKVAQGISHTGVVTFHELAPRLTRIELTFDVAPGSLIEKAARGMRHVKRAARADLHRFKAFIEMSELETGAWRGVIEDGELVEPHDDAYDEGREYSDLEALEDDASGDDEQEEPEDKVEAESNGGERRQRSAREGGRSRSAGASARRGGRPTRSTTSRSAGRSGGAGRRKPAGSRSSE